MGCHTEFRGSLRFNTKLTETQLSAIEQILREYCRDHPEWDAMELTYIDLALLFDNSGIQWICKDESSQALLNLLCAMRKIKPVDNIPEIGIYIVYDLDR